MPKLRYFVLDSFTKTRYAGNPAGVIFANQPLTDGQMRAVARELSLESVFLFPSTVPEADYTAAYYTGIQRIPLCGHDTIALAAALTYSGRLPVPGAVRLSTDVGILSVTVALDGLATMTQVLPHYGERYEAEVIALVLDLPVNAITDTGLPPQLVSTGTPFLIVPVAQKSQLNALKPNMAKLLDYGERMPERAAGFYLWSFDTEAEDALVHARCFAPALGLPEDPVTGSASGAFGAYLAQHRRLTPDADGNAHFWTEQGYAMERPGSVLVQITSHAGQVTQVQVGGYAVLVAEGTLSV